jgi:DNA polymerase III delta prime subunit
LKQSRLDLAEDYLKKQHEEYSSLNFALPQEDWVPSWLDRKIFDDEAPNALLKSVEEPPENTTFIFLTKNKEDLISTIVSRSQVFKLPAEKFLFDLKEISEIFEKYPDIDLSDAFEISKKIQEIAKEDNNLQEILNTMEQYFGEFLKNNPKSKKIMKDIKLIGVAKKRLKAFISPKNTIDSLLMDIAQY